MFEAIEALFDKMGAILHGPTVQKVHKKAIKADHVLYFGAVALGAHDVAALICGIMFVLVIIGAILHMEGEA